MMPNVTLGADPELGFLDKLGFIKEAKRVFEFGPMDNAQSARFGCDGTDAIAEMRPEPARDPLQLVRNIRRDMAEAVSRHRNLSKVTWKAGTLCDHYTLGGHIHFGAWEYMPELRATGDRGEMGRSTQMAPWFDAMHTLLSIPGALLERPQEAAQRRSQTGYGGAPSYGTWDTRAIVYQSHGFEYRPLASWLTSPHVAAGLLCLGKAIADDILGGVLTYDIAHGLFTKAGVSSRAFNAYDEAALRRAYREVCWPAIQKLSRYSEYKQYIDFINDLITKRLSWYPNVPMMEAWGIIPAAAKCNKEPDKLMLTNQDVWRDVGAVATPRLRTPQEAYFV